jgi:hypothetical protein
VPRHIFQYPGNVSSSERLFGSRRDPLHHRQLRRGPRQGSATASVAGCGPALILDFLAVAAAIPKDCKVMDFTTTKGVLCAHSREIALSFSHLLSLPLSWYSSITMKIDRATLAADPRVQRLLNNPNWKPAAEAAMKFLLEGVTCPIASWRKSSSWAQVEMVWQELTQSTASKPPSA